MKKVLMFFVFLVVIFINRDLQAQWIQTSGADGSQAISFLKSGSNLFSGTDQGVFISSDGGSNWIASNNGITSTEVREMAINGNNIFASTFGAGVFLSTNSGANWVGVNNGLTAINVETILFDNGNLFAGTLLGAFLSTDNGSNWTEVSTGLPFARHVKYLTVKGSNLFAGTIRGVYRSIDNGNNWIKTNNGLPDTEINAFAIMGDIIFAATDVSGFTGVSKSTDNGNNWTTPNNSGLSSSNVYSLAVSGTELFAGTDNGIFFSSDSGANWVAINDGLTNLFNISLSIIDNNIFAGMSNAGIWKRPLSEITAVEDHSNNLPVKYRLNQNYPNPFNPTTTIEYNIPAVKTGDLTAVGQVIPSVQLKIYDVLGREIAVLVNKQQKPGYYKVNFDASKLASGIYYYRISAGHFVSVKKMILLK